MLCRKGPISFFVVHGVGALELGDGGAGVFDELELLGGGQLVAAHKLLLGGADAAYGGDLEGLVGAHLLAHGLAGGQVGDGVDGEEQGFGFRE